MTDRRHTGLWIVAALLLTAVSTSAEEVSDEDRFQIWNGCKPVRLVVEGLPDAVTAIGLTEDAIMVAVRSRLRAARLYTEDRTEAAWSYLYINVNAIGRAFSLYTRYRKMVHDDATGLEYSATTWYVGMAGTHGGDLNYILSNVAQHADGFIDEYLRVNADAC